ncbi:hypothetical protein TMEN_2500 [Trichophyton mentagrophytes]|uniref:SGNH hydrolase-type esterase domain-containing protein n=1 Tax=Trichophyton interdigitale TaxID=101480 RepID=A0A9P4YN45_9EURO|nr:hypothetical protein GY631_0144 [Trichophyton interdigitale]KAF3901024.1 hypothetical protein GY632_0306 [Trichophyton interdigitale]KAG8208909.1 hypothetical protein GTR04_3697 [Trichophyton interdigitale]GBF60097.1 hypothetical protein TMEN_2500 [Trichophyton mentagrophytes]
MPHLKASAIALLLPLLFSSVIAEDVKLVGCDDVGCPPYYDSDRCTVENTTFIGVGVSPIPDVPLELEGFSLVKAVNVSATPVQFNGSRVRPFRSFYYLGTPEHTETSSLSGCAVIFNDPPVNKFTPPSGSDTFAATGTCADVIQQTCIDTIKQRARNAASRAGGNANACSALEQELKKDDFSGCSSFAGHGTSLGNFTVKSIGDLHAARNSSDCWPVQRKSDGLMQIAEVISNGSSSRAGDLYSEAYKITPVVTVFLGGNDSLVSNTTSQMTCLKMVSHRHYPYRAEDSAAALRGGWLAVTIATLVGIVVM